MRRTGSIFSKEDASYSRNGGLVMSRDSLFRSASRTSEAIEMLFSMYNKSGGIAPDLAPDYEGIQLWIWVPSSYSAIEQGLKLLIHARSGDPGWGHRLSDLYDNLHDSHRKILDEAYESYVQLHSYIPHKTLKPFLNLLDIGPPKKRGKGDQDGYTTWRYFLLDGFPKEEENQPKVSVGAMQEVARAIRYILEDEVISEKDEIDPPNITARLYKALHEEMFDMANQFYSENQGDADAFQSKYSGIHDLIVSHIEYVIRFLHPGKFPHPVIFREEQVPDELRRICKFLRGYDRENFFQYLSKVRDGTMNIPNHKFTIKEVGNG